MSELEAKHFEDRRDAERELAKASPFPDVAAVHEWLAQRYERLAELSRNTAPMPNRPLNFPSVTDTDDSVSEAA